MNVPASLHGVRLQYRPWGPGHKCRWGSGIACTGNTKPAAPTRPCKPQFSVRPVSFRLRWPGRSAKKPGTSWGCRSRSRGSLSWPNMPKSFTNITLAFGGCSAAQAMLDAIGFRPSPVTGSGPSLPAAALICYLGFRPRMPLAGGVRTPGPSSKHLARPPPNKAQERRIPGSGQGPRPRGGHVVGKGSRHTTYGLRMGFVRGTYEFRMGRRPSRGAGSRTKRQYG